MRTAVRETSLKAYDQLQAEGRDITQAAKILIYLREHPGSSRNDIAAGIPMRLASVCGRVKAMLEEQAPPIFVRGTKVDSESKLSVEQLFATPTQYTFDV